MIAKYFKYVLENPIKIIIAAILLSVIPGSFIVKLKINPDVESMVLKNDPSRIDMDRFRKQFGNDELFILAFSAEDVFDTKVLSFIKDLTQSFESLKYVKEVTSLYNTNRITSENNTLITGDFLEPLPTTKKQIQAKKEEALNTPLYQGDMFTKDFKYTSIVVRMKTENEFAENFKEEQAEISNFEAELDPDLVAELEKPQNQSQDWRAERMMFLADVKKIIKKESSRAMILGIKDFHYAGIPVTKTEMINSINHDNRIFLPLTIVVTMLLLFLAFRNWQGVLLPQIVIIMSLLPTLGVMGLLNIRINLVTSLLPIVVMVISVADVIHIIVRYYEAMGKTSDHKKALTEALNHIITPCFLTSFTTIIGFLSLLYADIPPIQHFGIFTALGVFSAFIFSVTIVPAILALSKPPSNRSLNIINGAWMETIINKIITLNESYKWPIFIFAIVIMLASVISIFHLTVETTFHKNFEPDSKLVKDIDYIDHHMAGVQPLEIMVETLCKAGENIEEHLKHKDSVMNLVQDKIKDIKTLKEMEKFQNYLQTLPEVKKTVSLVDTIKEISKSMHIKDGKEDPAYYKLPDTTGKAANYLFLYNSSAGPEDLDNMVDSNYTVARISIRMKAMSTAGIIRIVKQIKSYIKQNFSNNLHVTVTGTSVIYARMAQNLVKNQIVSFVLALVLIIITMTIIFRSFLIGLLSIIPNVLPVGFNFFIMVVSGIEFNTNTAMISSVAIGLVVDDTIHFFSRLIHEGRQVGDNKIAIRNTLHTVGRAMAFTSFILMAGFLVSMFSDFVITQNFGMLTAIVIFVALIADLILTSVIILIFKPDLRPITEKFRLKKGESK